MARKAKTTNSDDSLLITQHGYDELVAELEERKVIRDEIAHQIDEARDLGDLSENASYTVAMEKKELNENRIEELEQLIAQANIVNDSVQSDNVVTIGRIVEVQRVDDKSKRVIHLVGAAESDPLKNKVSSESPLGRALLNSRIGETVSVKLPTQIVDYKILKFADQSTKSSSAKSSKKAA